MKIFNFEPHLNLLLLLFSSSITSTFSFAASSSSFSFHLILSSPPPSSSSPLPPPPSSSSLLPLFSSSPPLQIPFYDEDSSTLFLSGKGENVVFAYEVTGEAFANKYFHKTQKIC